ncbi:MAG: hypothetical protein Q8K45_19410 [Rubrivivax sp.]|nr:hypothetical protein [Rubrivivax sp.]
MSKVFQSPGGSDSPASESQSEPAAPSEGLLKRLRLSVAGVCDVASLADELGPLGHDLHASDGDSRGLVVAVLAARISELANAICSALDDVDADVAELEGRVFQYQDRASMPDLTVGAAAAMLAAVRAEGALAQGGAA